MPPIAMRRMQALDGTWGYHYDGSRRRLLRVGALYPRRRPANVIAQSGQGSSSSRFVELWNPGFLIYEMVPA